MRGRQLLCGGETLCSCCAVLLGGFGAQAIGKRIDRRHVVMILMRNHVLFLAACVVQTLEKSFVSRTTTPERTIKAIMFGTAMHALKISAMVQTAETVM